MNGESKTMETRTEPGVAKLPKTLQFHDQIARLVQAYADKKGSNFQRVVQAAVLQFFFSHTGGPDQDWLTAFVELEKGVGDPPLDLARLPMKVYEDQARRLEYKFAALKQKYATKKPKSDEHTKYRDEAVKSFEKAIAWAHSEAGVWRTGIDFYGGGVDGAIERAIASDVEQDVLLHRMDRMEAEADAQNDDQ